MIRIGISSTDSRREHFIMNESTTSPMNVTGQILARNRQIVQKYGPYFGKQLFTIVAVNPDPKYKEDVMNGVNTFRNEIKAFIIKAIDIMSVSVVAKDLDQRPKIAINKDIPGVEPLMFEIAEPDFSKATRANVTEAIDRLGKTGASPMFFSAEDLPNLDKLVEEANMGAITHYENFARHCLNLAKTVRGYSDANKRIYTDYLRQCGIHQPDTEISIHAEITSKE